MDKKGRLAVPKFGFGATRAEALAALEANGLEPHDRAVIHAAAAKGRLR